MLVTVPPYAPFLGEVAAHRAVTGLRLNTVMPIKGTHEDILKALSALPQPLWVDLKGRQLRVAGSAIPPFTEVRLSHRIEVRTPCDVWFGGREQGRIAAVDGNRLILEDGPRRFIGPGESVNILDPSLRIHGTLTDSDRAYLAAMKRLGLKRVMISFVEQPSDIDEIRALLPGADLILKIESLRGLDFVREHQSRLGRLMCARGDLYVEVVRPHRIIGAARTIIAADADAIAASGIMPSLSRGDVPDLQDLTDVAFLLSLGYRTLMLGDEVCLRRDSVLAALDAVAAVAGELA